MICGIDAREIQNGIHTGIGRALSLFLQHIDSIDPRGKYKLFSSKPLAQSLAKSCENVVVSEDSVILWDQLTLASLCRKHAIGVFYSPYYKYPFIWNGPVVCTVMDLMFLDYEPYRRRLSLFAALYYRTIAATMVRRASAVITCSEYSKTQLQRIFKIPADKLHVIPLGLDYRYQAVIDSNAANAIRNRFEVSKGEYLLYSGNFKLHKNIKTLLRAFDILHEKIPSMKLVLMGDVSANAIDVRAQIAQSISGDHVIVTGPVRIEEQVALYSDARALVMPSAYEGFGYPPLEAMACATPVICSNATSLPEIAGDAALMVDPDSATQMADAVMRLIESPQLAAELKEKGLARARQFDSYSYAVRVFDLLQGVTK